MFESKDEGVHEVIVLLAFLNLCPGSGIRFMVAT